MQTCFSLLTRCTTKSEEDYRPLFENFVQDLLSTVNKPEWPAAELLLSLLGRLLVNIIRINKDKSKRLIFSQICVFMLINKDLNQLGNGFCII